MSGWRKWRIYYADRNPISDGDLPVEDIPAWGVIAIAYEADDGYRRLVHGVDNYWHDDGTWWGGNYLGFVDYMARPGWKKALFGRSVRDVTYHDMVRAVVSDPYIPVKP